MFINIDFNDLAKKMRRKSFFFVLKNFTAIKSLSLFRDSYGDLKFNIILKHSYQGYVLSNRGESIYFEVTYFYSVLLFFICEFRYFWKYLHRKFRYSRLIWGVFYQMVFYNTFLPLLAVFFKYFIKYRYFTHNLIRYMFWLQIFLLEIIPGIYIFLVHELNSLTVASLYIYPTGEYIFFGIDFLFINSLIGLFLLTISWFLKVFIFTYLFNAIYALSILSLSFVPNLFFFLSVSVLLLFSFILMLFIYLTLAFLHPNLDKLRLKNPITFKYWLSNYHVFLKKNS